MLTKRSPGCIRREKIEKKRKNSLKRDGLSKNLLRMTKKPNTANLKFIKKKIKAF